MKHILFVCSQNRWRSPTAEQVFSVRQDLECSSAGLNHDAQNPMTAELVAWADLIFVMEKVHHSKLNAKFRPYLANTRVICLNIPDKYEYMDPELVRLLKQRVGRFLPLHYTEI
ncbi:low molecular weight protein tyrosine phosphatase family protein [Candidatus Cyanaurora vandensis]|uniref:low molecular weight protein tyrosine phosphatase family protein n=1 Tax=Candidatus Cyanaurora vandensis TaxID=2714958 RepID=UPI0037BE31C6